MGWQAKLRKVYASFGEFDAYCEIYNLAKRLGFKTPQDAWDKNPMIRGSIHPCDYQLASKSMNKAIPKKKKRFKSLTEDQIEDSNSAMPRRF